MTVFSQTGTGSTTKIFDSSRISFPRIVGIRIAQDLIRYDSTKAENVILKKNLDLYKQNIDLKDKLIASKDQEISVLLIKQSNSDQIAGIRNEQLAEIRSVNKDLGKELKKRTVQRDILGGTAIALIIIEIARAVIK